jgi:hypothetical protein
MQALHYTICLGKDGVEIDMWRERCVGREHTGTWQTERRRTDRKRRENRMGE